MTYYHNLNRFLEQLRAEKTHTAALLMVEQDERVSKILEEVAEKGGGKREEMLSQFDGFIDYLGKFVFLEIERIEQDLEKGKLTTYESLIKLVAQYYWAELIFENKNLLEKIKTRVLEDTTINNKITSHLLSKRIDSNKFGALVSHAYTILFERMENGAYRGGSIVSFLCQTAYNQWRNDNRKRSHASLDEAYEVIDDTPGPLMRIISSETVDSIMAGLKQLSERCQQLIMENMAAIEKGEKQSSIAVRLGFKSRQAFTNSLSRCRQKLDEILSYRNPLK